MRHYIGSLIHFYQTHAWSQGAPARDFTGNEVHIDDGLAVEFDLNTAIYKIVPEDKIEEFYNGIQLTPQQVLAFNDEPANRLIDIFKFLERLHNEASNHPN